MRCNSGRDEQEHAVFQVEIYGGERDGWAAWQWQGAAGWGGLSCCPRLHGTARLSTFSV